MSLEGWAPWAFQRMLKIDGSPRCYRMHPDLYRLACRKAEVLRELVEEAAR